MPSASRRRRRGRSACIVCGTPAFGPRCPAHTVPDQRGTRKQRGYDEDWYRRVRAAIERQPWCTYCSATEDLTGDHPIPLALGGPRDQEPIVACRRCNSSRGASVTLRRPSP